jgi:ABC-type sugar transport system ATPase subunit
MAEVSLRHVYKRYPKGDAVKDVNLEIKDGEFVVLVGPSGCGKSTTLRMVAGLEEISDGELWIGGKQVNHVPPRDRDIAMVFQSYALYPHMTVFDNMAFGLSVRGFETAEIKRRVHEAAHSLGLVEYLSRLPKELSGGQRQRVAMGRALVRRPQVFLFDEPLSNLDANLRVRMRAEIAQLHKRLHATTVYVTHDQVEAMTLADRIVVMKAGIVQQVGAPLEVFASPHNQFVASFLGSPPMNFLSGRVSDDGTRFLAPDASFPLEGAASLAGRQVRLGVRPQHLIPSHEGIAAEVEVIERTGAEAFLHARAQGVPLVARVAANASFSGKILLAPEPGAAYLFDLQSEETLLTASRGA